MSREWTYSDFVDEARADERVVGLVLTGSRGRGLFVRPESDWDVRLIVRDESLAECEELFGTPHGSAVDLAVYSRSQFEHAGGLGSPNEWDRYSYAHAEVVLDKLDGEISALVAEKAVLPDAAARDIAERAFDGYVNSYFRSAKNHGIGLPAEAHLDAAESISLFLTALFAMHGRVRPFNKYLGWELETFPLGNPLWSAEALVPRLRAILSEGALAEQQGLFRDAEQFARERELGAVLDGWDTDLDFLRGD